MTVETIEQTSVAVGTDSAAIAKALKAVFGDEYSSLSQRRSAFLNLGVWLADADTKWLLEACETVTFAAEMAKREAKASKRASKRAGKSATVGTGATENQKAR